MILPLFVLLFCLTFWGLDWSLLYKEFSAVLLLCLLQSWFILIFFSEFLVLFCFSFGFIIVFPLSCLFVFFSSLDLSLFFPWVFFLIFDLIPNFGALWRIRVLNTSQHSCILDIIRSQLMNLANAECRRAPLPQAWSKTNSWSENFSPMQISQSPALKWCWWEDKGNLHISGTSLCIFPERHQKFVNWECCIHYYSHVYMSFTCHMYSHVVLQLKGLFWMLGPVHSW